MQQLVCIQQIGILVQQSKDFTGTSKEIRTSFSCSYIPQMEGLLLVLFLGTIPLLKEIQNDKNKPVLQC